MATSDVGICNLALAHLGETSITGLTEGSAASNACNSMYDFIRRATLRKGTWNFATRTAALSLLDETAVDYTYVYSVPTKYLRAIGLHPVDSKKFFTMRGRKIYTNEAEAILEYIEDVTDPNLFDDVFTLALSFRLASALAIQITGNAQNAMAMLQQYEIVMAEAEAVDADEDHTDKLSQLGQGLLESRVY